LTFGAACVTRGAALRGPLILYVTRIAASPSGKKQRLVRKD